MTSRRHGYGQGGLGPLTIFDDFANQMMRDMNNFANAAFSGGGLQRSGMRVEETHRVYDGSNFTIRETHRVMTSGGYDDYAEEERYQRQYGWPHDMGIPPQQQRQQRQQQPRHLVGQHRRGPPPMLEDDPAFYEPQTRGRTQRTSHRLNRLPSPPPYEPSPSPPPLPSNSSRSRSHHRSSRKREKRRGDSKEDYDEYLEQKIRQVAFEEVQANPNLDFDQLVAERLRQYGLGDRVPNASSSNSQRQRQRVEYPPAFDQRAGPRIEMLDDNYDYEEDDRLSHRSSRTRQDGSIASGSHRRLPYP